jgi:catechol-2,3-dioxygenase
MTSSVSPSPSLEVAAVLAADQPADLARFYGALLEQLPLEGLNPDHWRLRLPSGTWLEIYRPSRARPQPRQRGRLSLCLRRLGSLPVLEAWIDAVQAHGGLLVEGPRQEPFGAEAWVQDPEGNGLLLLVSRP